MTLDISVDTHEGCFDLPEWADLLTRDPDRQVFSTPEWNRLWWEEFGTGKDLVFVTMARAGRLVAIVPLYRKIESGAKVLRFLGGIDLTDYLGPICAPEDKEAVAESLVHWLVTSDYEWDEFDAHNLPVPFGFAEYFVDHADRAGFDFRLEQEETAAILLLPESFDAYLSSLRSKERHEIKRKRHRLQREHRDARVRSSRAETLDVDLKTFIEMHRGAQGHKGHFMNPEIASFFERIAYSFMDVGWLRLDFLEVGGRAVSSTFSFELDGRLFLYNSAYEPDAARLSPGLVLVSMILEGAIERGLVAFDFLRGPERYKYALGAQPVPLNNVRLQRGNQN